MTIKIPFLKKNKYKLVFLREKKVFIIKCYNLINHESTIVCEVPIFVVFMGRSNHEVWFPTNKRHPIDLYTENIQTTKSMKIGIHELKYSDSIIQLTLPKLNPFKTTEFFFI